MMLLVLLIPILPLQQKTANADYDTIKVGIPNLSNSAWEKEFNGINGQCDYYVSGSDGNYKAQINCPIPDDKKHK